MPLNDGWDCYRMPSHVDLDLERCRAVLWLLESGWSPWRDGEIIAGCVLVPQEWADGDR